MLQDEEKKRYLKKVIRRLLYIIYENVYCLFLTVTFLCINRSNKVKQFWPARTNHDPIQHGFFYSFPYSFYLTLHITMRSFKNNKTKRRNRSKQLKRGEEEELDVVLQPNKDRFIDLAQAALEEADLEEERKGVIQEVVEALISKTGAPLVAEVISEQLHSQDVIERLAEIHEENRRRTTEDHRLPLTRIESTDSINSIKSPDDEELEKDKSDDELFIEDDHNSRFILIAEYLWRFFRILILSSLVGLVCHFLHV